MKKHLSRLVFLFVLLAIITSCNTDTPEQDDGMTKISYTESDSLIINPERGFYSQYDFLSSNLSEKLSSSTVNALRSFGQSLILTSYYLDEFRDKPISNEFLKLISDNMKVIRDGGVKCVLRFAYTDDKNNKPWDAPQDTVNLHIQQLTPILIENSDVITVLQAGFIGVWGEWFYTSNFIMSPITQSDYAPRKAVLDALLQALPKNRMIAVRTPTIKTKSFNISYSDSITALTAYDGSDLSRIACHNDCFLADGSDMGTFSNIIQMSFWEHESKYTSMGGETCQPSTYCDCANALLQLEKYHWSYINSGYHGVVINNWRTNNCLDNIKKRLGYRFVLTQGKFSKLIVANQKFEIKLNIKNVGFAAPYNPRDVNFIFISKTNANEKYTFEADVDPRRWFAGGEYSINFSTTLSSQMKGKEFDIYLNLPDPEPTLSNRSEYSIQLANKNTWSKATGYNKLHSIKVD